MRWLDDLTNRAIIDGVALYRANLYRPPAPHRRFRLPTLEQAMLLMAYTLIAVTILVLGIAVYFLLGGS